MTATPSFISRRRFLVSTSLTATGALLSPTDLFAQRNVVRVPGLVEPARKSGETATIAVQRLRGNISALLGSGGNIAVLTGRDGKLLVDSGYAGTRARIAEALAGLSSDPIKHLINTHFHFDHTDGNEWLHAAGAAILAHENTRKHLATATRVEGWDFTFPPLPAGGIPTTVFSDQKTLHLNGVTMALKYYPPAHTDGDISVHFTEADVFHTGDTWWNGYYPFIDYSNGGSIDGMIRATEANLAHVTEKTIIIPGHGPVAGISQLTVYRDLLGTVREKVATLKKQGRSLTEIVAAKPTAAYDAKWGAGFMNPANFTGLVFQGV